MTARLGAAGGFDLRLSRRDLEDFLPATPEELYAWQVACMILFALVATVLANWRKAAGERLDFHFIARNAMAGSTFPISLVLVFYPVLPQVRGLFTVGNIGIYLSLAGALGAMLTFYSLVK